MFMAKSIWGTLDFALLLEITHWMEETLIMDALT